MSSFVQVFLTSAPEILANTSTWMKVPAAFLIQYAGRSDGKSGRTYSHYAKELKNNPDCQKFFSDPTNRTKFQDIQKKIYEKAPSVFKTLGNSNAYWMAIKGSGLQCVGQLMESAPLLAFALQTSSVLGLLGTGIVVVTVLTPVLPHLIDLVADILNCKESTKDSIHQWTDKLEILARFNALALPAMLYANTFSQNGLQAGLIGMANFTIPLAVLIAYFVKKYRSDPSKVEDKLKQEVIKWNKIRKTLPSDEELKKADALDKETCKEFYAAVEKREKAENDWKDKKDALSQLNSLDNWYTKRLIEDLQKIKENKSLDTVWAQTSIDKEALSKPIEDLQQNIKKMINQVTEDISKAKDIYEIAQKEAIEVSCKTEYPTKHQTYKKVEQEYQKAMSDYKSGPDEYKKAVGKLRATKSSRDELPYLAKYMKMLMDIDALAKEPKSWFYKPGPQFLGSLLGSKELSQEEADKLNQESFEKAKVKVEELDKKTDTLRKELFADEDDCMEKHLTHETVKWLKRYESDMQYDLKSYKEYYKLIPTT